ncbi:hypothetical protein P7L79_22075 [Tistrella mobilis]|uniref:hypothetical protein n=1 Tax=Tistrella mobilis TaxID=171437 RepID=UPI0035577272
MINFDELQDGLARALTAAIREMGMENFKRMSIFGSNEMKAIRYVEEFREAA